MARAGTTLVWWLSRRSPPTLRLTSIPAARPEGGVGIEAGRGGVSVASVMATLTLDAAVSECVSALQQCVGSVLSVAMVSVAR